MRAASRLEALPAWVRGDLADLDRRVQRTGAEVVVDGARFAPTDEDGVAGALYGAWYLRCERPRRDAIPGPADLDPVRAYRAARLGVAPMLRGYQVQAASTSGRVLAAADGGEPRVFDAGDYVTPDRPGATGAPGDGVAVAAGGGDVDSQPGCWVWRAPGFALDAQPLVRVYWRATSASAARLVAAITGTFDGLSYAMKAPAQPGGFGRADALVLYLPRERWGAVAGLVAALVAAQPQQGERPALTRPLGPGIGLAEGPPDGGSYGQLRCRSVAAAVRRWAHDGNGVPLSDRVVVALEEEGIDPVRPHLLASSEEYELPAPIRFTPGSRRRSSPPAPAAAPEVHEPPADLLQAAATLGDRLVSTAVRHEDRALWLGCSMEQIDGDWRPVHRSLGGDLYAGSSGVGLFLAQLSAVTGDRAQADAAMAAAAHALHTAGSDQLGPGLYLGRIGVAWAVREIGLALGEDDFSKRGAKLWSRGLDDLEATLADGVALEDDLLAGRAGLLLAALHGPEPRVDLARRLGDDLVASSQPQVLGRAWPSSALPGSPLLCGLAHGGSGPALALSELAAITGDERYEEVAAEACLYERSWFDRERCAWPDLREWGWAEQRVGRPPPAPVFWCHGAIGVGLSRLRSWQLTGDELLLADLTAAVHAARANTEAILRSDPDADPYAGNVSVCHGASGTAQLLLDAAVALGHEDLLAVAGRLGLYLARTHVGGGRPVACGIAGGWEAPGLMLGLAGFGLTLLRIADPTRRLGIGLPLVGSSR